MKRLAVIVKGFSNDSEELKDDLYFVNKYKAYLGNIAGGAWEENEIKELFEPTGEDLIELINQSNLDYSLLILIGHGAIQEDNQLFQINENEIIRAGHLDFGAPKQLVILESCRSNIENISPVDLTNKIPNYKNGGVIRFPITRNNAKALFWKEVQACEDGVVVCFACSRNEAAFNYYFSSILLSTSFEWYLDPRNHSLTLNILDLMNRLKKIVPSIVDQNCGECQMPDYFGKSNFPFGINKY